MHKDDDGWFIKEKKKSTSVSQTFPMKSLQEVVMSHHPTYRFMLAHYLHSRNIQMTTTS